MRAAVGHHLKESAAAVLVLQMLLEVACQIVDLLGEERNLDLRRAGVLVVYGHFFDRFGLFLLGQHEQYSITTPDFAQGLAADVPVGI